MSSFVKSDTYMGKLFTLIRIPLMIYQNKEILHKWAIQLLAYLNLGKTDIVILGRPSVGKTVLSQHLIGKAKEHVYKLPEASVEVESDAVVVGKWAKLIRVIPGQTSSERSQGLFEAFSDENSKLDGVIYVVDWGYTDYREEGIEEKLIDQGINSVEKLIEWNLQSELNDLQSVLDTIEHSCLRGKGPKWLLIAINKVDLYLNDLDAAKQYYSIYGNDRFSQILDSFIKKLGKNNIKCSIAPISAWQSNFKWGKEIVHTNLGGRQVENDLTTNFLRTIAKLNS